MSFSFSTHSASPRTRPPPPPQHTHNKQTKTEVQLSTGIHALIRNPGWTKINLQLTFGIHLGRQHTLAAAGFLPGESPEFLIWEKLTRISHLGKLTRISHLGKTHQNFPSGENLPLDETHKTTTHPTPLALAQTRTHSTQTPRRLHNVLFQTTRLHRINVPNTGNSSTGPTSTATARAAAEQTKPPPQRRNT